MRHSRIRRKVSRLFLLFGIGFCLFVTHSLFGVDDVQRNFVGESMFKSVQEEAHLRYRSRGARQKIVGEWEKVIDEACSTLTFGDISKKNQKNIANDFKTYLESRRSLRVRDSKQWIKGVRNGLRRVLEGKRGILSERERLSFDRDMCMYVNMYADLLWASLHSSKQLSVNTGIWQGWSRRCSQYGAGGMVYASGRMTTSDVSFLKDVLYKKPDRRWQQAKIFVFNFAISQLVHDCLMQKLLLSNLFLAPVAEENISREDLRIIKRGANDIKNRIEAELSSFVYEETFYYDGSSLSSYCEVLTTPKAQLSKDIDIEETKKIDWTIIDRPED